MIIILSASVVGHQSNSHEEFWRGRVVTGGPSLAEPVRASQFLAFEFVRVSLAGQPVYLLLELLHLIDELGLLILQDVLLLDPFEATRLSVAPILQGPAFLLQADHLVLGKATQVSVELSHRHGHQLIIGEAVLHIQPRASAMMTLLARMGMWVMMMVVTMVELLMRRRRGRRRAVWFLAVVMVVLAVRVIVGSRVTCQVIWVMRNAWVLVVVLLGMSVVMMMVRCSIPIEAPLLKLLLDVWRWRVPVGRGTNQGFHCVFRGQAQCLWIHLLMITTAGHPVQFFQVVLLFCWAEAW